MKDEDNSFAELFELLGVLARQRYQAAEHFYAELGLNHTEGRLLLLLEQEKGVCTQDRLASLIHVDRSNSGRGIKRLEASGCVDRQKGDDKRTNIVQLTNKGHRVVIEIQKLRKEMSRSFFGELSSSEAHTVVTLLQKALASQT